VYKVMRPGIASRIPLQTKSLYSILRHAVLGFTQPLTEMRIRGRKMFLDSRTWPVRRANNLAASCEPIV
jgi:hypothetical protein